MHLIGPLQVPKCDSDLTQVSIMEQGVSKGSPHAFL